jgi:hypothetical protein
MTWMIWGYVGYPHFRKPSNLAIKMIVRLIIEWFTNYHVNEHVYTRDRDWSSSYKFHEQHTDDKCLVCHSSAIYSSVLETWGPWQPPNLCAMLHRELNMSVLHGCTCTAAPVVGVRIPVIIMSPCKLPSGNPTVNHDIRIFHSQMKNKLLEFIPTKMASQLAAIFGATGSRVGSYPLFIPTFHIHLCHSANSWIPYLKMFQCGYCDRTILSQFIVLVGFLFTVWW